MKVLKPSKPKNTKLNRKSEGTKIRISLENNIVNAVEESLSSIAKKCQPISEEIYKDFPVQIIIVLNTL